MLTLPPIIKKQRKPRAKERHGRRVYLCSSVVPDPVYDQMEQITARISRTELAERLSVIPKDGFYYWKVPASEWERYKSSKYHR